MTETRTTYLGLPQYSIDTDSVLSRTDANEAFGNLEARAAYDDGISDPALPVTLLKPGRYARRDVTSGFSLYRRGAAAWEWVGGPVMPVRRYYRGAAGSDVAWSTDVAAGAATATMSAGGELGTTALVRSVLGGSFGADLVTDLTDPTATGRAYVRTRATGERGVVVRAHASDAGNLLTALESGGSSVWSVDAAGRMRSAAPVGLGGSSPTTNVPLAVSPGGTDITALDLYGATSGPKPALRVFRSGADADDIVHVLPDVIRLGRSAPAWIGGLIELRAPTINLIGATDVAGALSVDSLGVDGAAVIGGAVSAASATLAGALSAASASLSGALTAGSGAVTGTLTAEGGKVTSFSSGSTSGLRTQVVTTGGTATRDQRHSLAWRKRIVNIDFAISNTSLSEIYQFTFTPSTTCYLDLSLGVTVEAIAAGASGSAYEPCSMAFMLRILADDNTTILYTGDEVYSITVGALGTWGKVGHGQVTVSEIPGISLTAGTNYRVQFWGHRIDGTAVSVKLRHIMGVLREAVLLG